MQQDPTSEKEKKLIQGFKNGENEAQRTILKQFYQPILYFAQRLTGNTQESEDITGNVFFTLFSKPANFNTITNIKAFLYLSTRNQCLNWIKKNKRAGGNFGMVVSLSENHEAYNVPESPSDQPFWASVDVEMIEKVYRLIEDLPGKCRDIFIRHYIYGDKVNDIARELGIKPGTVSTQLKIGIAKIQAGLLLTILFLIIIIHFFMN